MLNVAVKIFGANVCPFRLHGCMLNFMHLSAMGVTNIKANAPDINTEIHNIAYSVCQFVKAD